MPPATDMQCEDLFDSIDDLLDFQNYDDLLEMMDGSDNGGSVAPSLQAPAIAGEIHGRPAAVTGGRFNSEVDALRCLCEDVEIINSDWLSNIFEDSELSPLSVLEAKIVSPKTRARTKRPRAHVTPSLTRWVPEPEIMENKRKLNVRDNHVLKRCLHCDSQKTPQWRAGPTGPKTLCNACGVRYKSGRLFSEYRPVASPSFIPSIHSNSHKKVVEMRQQRANLNLRDGEVATKNWDLLDYIKNK